MLIAAVHSYCFLPICTSAVNLTTLPLFTWHAFSQIMQQTVKTWQGTTILAKLHYGVL